MNASRPRVTLYSGPLSMLGAKAQIAALEAAVTAIDATTRYYAEMEKQLADQEWLAGPYCFADIAFYMAALFGERQGALVTSTTPKLLAWRDRMTRRPAVHTVVSAMAAWLKGAGRPVPAFMLLT